jgi:hypothetical protein
MIPVKILTVVPIAVVIVQELVKELVLVVLLEVAVPIAVVLVQELVVELAVVHPQAVAAPVVVLLVAVLVPVRQNVKHVLHLVLRVAPPCLPILVVNTVLILVLRIAMEVA